MTPCDDVIVRPGAPCRLIGSPPPAFIGSRALQSFSEQIPRAPRDPVEQQHRRDQQDSDDEPRRHELSRLGKGGRTLVGNEGPACASEQGEHPRNG